MPDVPHWPIGKPMPWAERAACAPHNYGSDISDWFFPVKYETSGRRKARERKAADVCRGCPVKMECDADRGEEGFWGGKPSRSGRYK
jgi:hypothetical protein